MVSVLLLVACLAVTAAQTLPLRPDSFRGFIAVRNGRFVDEDCQEFPVVGFNGWQLMESAAGVANFSDVDGLDAVQYTFAQAAKDGQTVVRVFGHGINETLALQPAPGVYSEQAFAGLDYVLDTAAQYGIRVIMTMADYWLGVDSYDSYVKWANATDNPDRFFYEDGARTLFRNHMQAMTSRRNSINGLAYKDDPTIFAWDLMNEVRCDCFPATIEAAQADSSCNPTCADNVTTWITDMANYLKELDPKHLVTVGEEGYWASYDSQKQYNPGNGWAQITGQNFTAQHSPASIDFAAIHFWPDLWTPNDTRPFDFLGSWIEQHEIAAKSLGKPLILEEFGKNVTLGARTLQDSVRDTRMPIFKFIYNALNESLAEGNSLRGVMFWQWGMAPQNSDTNNIEVAAYDVDYTSVVVPSAAAALASAQAASPVANCTKTASSSNSAPAPISLQLPLPSTGSGSIVQSAG